MLRCQGEITQRIEPFDGVGYGNDELGSDGIFSILTIGGHASCCG